MEIQIRYHDVELPRLCAVEGGDWIDLRAAERVEMKAGEFRIISLGISMKLPEGYEAHVVPRSSTFKRWGILQTNHMGVIDNAYCGDGDVWGFPALAMRDTVIEKGDRICQFRIVQKMEPVRFVEVDHLDVQTAAALAAQARSSLKRRGFHDPRVSHGRPIQYGGARYCERSRADPE